jgi:type II secretory pathway component PulC
MAARITDIIPYFLITLLCVGTVEGGYKMLEYFIMRSPVEKAAISTTVTAKKELADKDGQKKKQDYHIILQRNLFGPLPGKGGSGTNDALDYADNLESTSLNIVLMGTINDSKKGEQRAIILDKSTDKQALYEKGDAIQGAFVKKILRGKVILVYNGKDEVLDINDAAKERQAFASAPDRPASRAVRTGPLSRPEVIPRRGESPRTRVISRPSIIRPSRSTSNQ